MFFYLVDKFEDNYDKSINKLQYLLRIFNQLSDIGIDPMETFFQSVKEIDNEFEES